ncbi:hypothetical protein sscle_01g002460 [Sclerotinia sclerotiorum 1980 UF-70]|nr:hypothetical protein sscle_01g002460 [Sclerotinia sclerotiorum 1980 UF-70]
MVFFQHRSKARRELASNEAALDYYRKKHSLPPMQQPQRIQLHPLTPRAQEVVDTSSAPISIGNVFQEGITSLPVICLSEPHVLRLQKLKAQRPKDSSSPNGEKRLRKENKRTEAKGKMEKIKKKEKMNKSTSIEEDQPRTIDIITQPTSISSLKIRKASQTKLQKYINFTSPKKLSKKSPESPVDKVKEKVSERFEEEIKEEVEKEDENEFNSHIETAANTSLLFKPDTTTFTNNPNWPLR